MARESCAGRGIWCTSRLSAPSRAAARSPATSYWTGAIVGISGPLLPSLVGYIMFGFWLSGFGRRWRTRSAAMDVFSTGLAAMMLSAQIFALVPMIGMVHDGDYSGYINNIPIPHWQANGFLILLSITNAVLVFTLIKHLVRTYRPEISLRRLKDHAES